MYTVGEKLLVFHLLLKQSSLGKSAVFSERKSLETTVEPAMVDTVRSTRDTLRIERVLSGKCPLCALMEKCCLCDTWN